MNPFEVLEKDVDDFIMMSNYVMSLEAAARVEAPTNKGGEARIRVNDKTATGGWF